MTLRPAVLDRHVLSFDVAGFARALAERGRKRYKRAGRRDAEETDDRHRLLPRAERASPSLRRRAGAAIRGGSFDDLVGAGEDRWRHTEAERLGGLEIDHQLEFSRLLDRQVSGLRALEALPDVNADLAIDRGEVRSIAVHAAGSGTLTQEIAHGSLSL